jgi:putative effector of murein hydrolase
MLLNGALVALGIVLAAWGLPAAHRLKGIPGILAAFTVLAGVLLALYGTLIVAVPDFFKG